jgi:hypothetical protein
MAPKRIDTGDMRILAMASAHSLAKLIKFIRRTEWGPAFAEVLDEHLEHACGAHRIHPGEIFDVLGDDLAATLHGCALEDFLSREYEGARNVIDEYLKRRGYAESGGNRRYMLALRSSVMSLYEVSDVVPGQSFLARDLVRDLEPVRVLEVSGTRTLKQWDRIGARLIREGSEWRMSGGVLAFDREASDFLLATLRRIDGELPDDLRRIAIEKLGREVAATIDKDLAQAPQLAMMAPAFSSIWLTDALQRALNPQLPELVNRDGHSIVLCASRFPLLKKAGASACRKALATVPDLVEAGTKHFNWIGAAGEPTAAPGPLANRKTIALMTTSSSGDTILGSVEIKRDVVELSTNSRERATKGEMLIAEALAGLVGPHRRKEETGAELLTARRKSRQRKPSDEVPPEIARPIIHAHLDHHYRETLDRALPALGNVSPREAARSDAGRARVVDWLKEMENHAAKAGGDNNHMASYDFGWIWQELDVAELRA